MSTDFQRHTPATETYTGCLDFCGDIFRDSFAQAFKTLDSESDLPGGLGGLTLPMIFLTPRVSVDLSSWGSILTPVLVLHVSVTC